MTPVLLALLSLGTCRETPGCLARARVLAPIVAREARRVGLDPKVVAAVAYRESHYDPLAVGGRGELGPMQVLPGGPELALCRGLRWRTDLASNVRCGVRILARARTRCGGSPARWVAAYNRWRCGPSAYSHRVLYLLGDVDAVYIRTGGPQR